MNPFITNIMQPNFWLSCLTIDENSMCRQVRGDHDVLYVTEQNKSCPTEILDVLCAMNAEGRPIWKPMHLQPVYEKNDFITAAEGEDVGKDIFCRGLCLPSDIKMTEQEQEIIMELIKNCFV